MATSNNSATTNFGGGPVFKKNYATAEPFIDMTNTGFTKTTLSNIAIIGNGTSGDIGIKAHDLRERMPAFDNVSVTGFDTGMELSKATFTDIRGLSIFSCATTGLSFTSTLAKSNTLNFYGGRILSNPTDITFASSSAVDVKFYGTRIEGLATGHVKAVNVASGNYGLGFYGCSFEKNTETTPEIILENGNNNTYFNCRFDSDVSYTPVHLGASARNINLICNFFQTNTAATTSTILIDAGAVSTNIIGNTKGTATVGTVTLTDNGTLTTCIGNNNTAINDKVPNGLELGANRLRFIEAAATQVSLRDSGNTVYRSLSVNGIGCAELRSQNQIDVALVSVGLFNPVVPTKFDDYQDLKAISAPASPASGYVRVYPKATDANTDSLYMKAKVQGAVEELNFFP